MTLSIIVALAENNVIGRGGRLPWHLSADLQRFKRLTMGHHIVMGRKTWESIGRPLPGRTSIVVSRQTGYSAAGAVVADSLDAALQQAAEDDQVFVIGGGDMYRQALPLADRLCVTRVHADVPGDTYFPPLSTDRWRLVSEEHHPADEQNDHPHSFQVYQRLANREN